MATAECVQRSTCRHKSSDNLPNSARPAAHPAAVSPSTGLLERLDSIHPPHPRHPNPHSPSRDTHVPTPAVSSFWRFAYAGPRGTPRHRHGAAIRKPSQKQPFTCKPPRCLQSRNCPFSTNHAALCGVFRGTCTAPVADGSLACAGQPSEPSEPGRLRNHHDQSSGSNENGSACDSSRAAQIGQCGFDRAGRPRKTKSINSSRITWSATAGMPRFQLAPTGMPTSRRTRLPRSTMNAT